MRRAITVLLLAALTGCGASSPPPEQQVRVTLRTFATAVEKRDYQTLCDKVFAPKLLQGLQQIGLPCEIAMQKSFASVKDPKLTVGTVTVSGAKASAQVRTSATGQAPSSDTLELTRVKGRWRVSALGGAPAAAPKTAPSATP